MEIKPTSFDIPFPIKIFGENRVNLTNYEERDRLFRRNIYYFLSRDEKNNLLEKRWKIFLGLAEKIKEFLHREYPVLNLLSVSIFGSGLHSENNDDYDFLVIVGGNLFDNLQTKINFDKIDYSIGISIKGEENFLNGIIDKKTTKFNSELQNKIINRTSISLPYRHLPLLGLDFKENKEIFLLNCPAQIYDLLINTYEKYYLVDQNNKPSNKTRVRKILSRIFEASKYMDLIFPRQKVEDFQRQILSLKSTKQTSLRETKKLFVEFVDYYNELVESY